MLLPFVLFLVLAVWGLIDGELYAKEAAIYGALWVVCLLGLLFVPAYGLTFVVPACLIDVVLLVKLVGNPAVS